MTALFIIGGIVVFLGICAMTILYFQQASELERTKSKLQLTEKKLKVETDTNEAIWRALIASDDAEEIKFGDF